MYRIMVRRILEQEVVNTPRTRGLYETEYYENNLRRWEVDEPGLKRCPQTAAVRVFSKLRILLTECSLVKVLATGTSLSRVLVSYLCTLSWRSMGRPPVQRLCRQ